MKKLLLVIAMAIGLSAAVATPASAVVSKYDAWLNQTAVIASVDGHVTTYTERQVGTPAFQAVMKQRLATTGVVTPNTVYFGCPSEIGCYFRDTNGGGWRAERSVGSYGTNTCWTDTPFTEDAASAASADYGSGWDIKIWANNNCGGLTWVAVLTSHSATFTGALSYMNDVNDSGMITQAG